MYAQNSFPPGCIWLFFGLMVIVLILGLIVSNQGDNVPIPTPNTSLTNNPGSQPMNNPTDATNELLLSAIMGILGGLISTPFNAIFTWLLKRDEQKLQFQLDLALKRYELLQQHKFEIERERLKRENPFFLRGD